MPRRLRRCAVLACVLCLLPVVAPAQPSERAEALDEFRQFVARQMAADHIPGMTIGYRLGQETWVEGFGYSDLENQVPAKPESAYRLASVTKPMTAMAVLSLVEQGKIDLDETVQTYVPFFPQKPWPVPVRLVLGHLGGIYHYRNYDEEGHFKEHKDTRESIAVFADWDLLAEPGTRYQYSSYGYNLLGAVIEGASDMSYGQYLRQTLWDPMGMTDTRMDDPYAIIPHRVRGYQQGPDGDVIPSEFVDISSRFAAGGTRSTVVDLLKFSKGLSEGKILSPETYDLMWTSMSTADGEPTAYGMGWGVYPVNGRFRVQHSGGQAETSTQFTFFPTADFAIAIACNLEGTNKRPYERALYFAVLGELWAPAAHTSDPAGDLVYDLVDDAFNLGVGHFDRYGKPRVSDPAKVSAAFEAFDHVRHDADPDEVREALRSQVEALGDHPTLVVGSHIASELARAYGPKRIERAYGEGPFAFLAAYAELCERDDSISTEHRLDQAMVALAARWNEDWQRTFTPQVEELASRLGDDVPAVSAELASLFEGTEIRPDYVPQYLQLIEFTFLSAGPVAAHEAGEAALSVYPRSDQLLVYTGLTELALGRAEAARERIAHALEIDPQGAASAGWLNGLAYRVRSVGQLDLGLGILDIARTLHPDDANLYDSTGEFYLAKGNQEKGIAFYRRALEIDPDFENAKRVLEQLGAGGDL